MDKFNKMLAGSEPMVLSIFRFITGLLLFQYGVAKLFKYPPVPMFAKVELMSLYGAAGSLELVLGGASDDRPLHPAGRLHPVRRNGVRLFPRPLSRIRQAGFIPLLNGGNAAILFCFACLYLSRRRRTVQRRCDDAEEVAEQSSLRERSEAIQMPAMALDCFVAIRSLAHDGPGMTVRAR